MGRIYNFSAGPSILPLPALEEAAEKLVEFEGTGMSLIEMSHRGKTYSGVHNETLSLAREILEIPDDFVILFIQGGATLQFGMVPMAFLGAGKVSDYVLTGTWSKKACNDAKTVGEVKTIWDGGDDNYTRMPSQDELLFTSNASYAHICSNETIGGIQFKMLPDTGGIPLVVDMSSDIMSRKISWDRVSMIYAGTQKNLAPAGMSFIIMKKSFVEKARKDLPAYLRYDLHAEKDSLYNTPPSFVIWMTNLTFKWIKSKGGIAGIEKLGDQKADLLYSAIDSSGGYYRNPVDTASRSKMNIVWRLPDEGLEKKFIEEADKEGLSSLKGHRSVGGCRASIYNAMPIEGVQALVDFMKDFMNKNG